MFKKYWPHLLLVVYLIEFIFCAIGPVSFDVWLDKNLAPAVIVLAFVILFVSNIRFSNFSYTLAIIFPLINTMGGYLGFGDNSLNVFNNVVSIGGDIFEKLGHFSFGFYAYPLIEILHKSKKIENKWLAIFVVVGLISFITMDYEMVEIFTAIKNGEINIEAITASKFGILYIQKDIFMGAFGSVFSSIVYLLFNRDKK